MLQNILDLVLPRFCVGCQIEGSWICETCLGTIQIPREQHCPFCEATTPAGRTCENHRSTALAGCLTAGYYHDHTLRDALHRYKYEFAEDLAPTLSAYLARMALKFRSTLPEHALVIPIPLATPKLRERGFNQTRVLAEAVATTLALEITPVALKRIHNTPPQAQLGTAERTKNLRGAFRANTPDIIRGRSILLIDDVLTTGTTMEAAAEALKAAGAKEIFGLVLARG